MRVTLILLLLLISHFSNAADTLRYYQVDRLWASTYAPSTYPKQIARFEPQGPASIKSIIVTLSGTKGGTALLQMFGHEGGTVHPQLQANLFPPVTITKTTDADDERIEVLLIFASRLKPARTSSPRSIPRRSTASSPTTTCAAAVTATRSSPRPRRMPTTTVRGWKRCWPITSPR